MAQPVLSWTKDNLVNHPGFVAVSTHGEIHHPSPLCDGQVAQPIVDSGPFCCVKRTWLVALCHGLGLMAGQRFVVERAAQDDRATDAATGNGLMALDVEQERNSVYYMQRGVSISHSAHTR